MTKDELANLEETIAASFIRSNVLSIEEAKKHAGLAVCHVRNALRDKQQAEADEQPDERTAFEAWARGEQLSTYGYVINGHYHIDATQWAWKAWQARSMRREAVNPWLLAALKDAVHFIRSRHNMGRGTREQERLKVLANAQEALLRLEEQGRRG